jgi:DNA modification methylase
METNFRDVLKTEILKKRPNLSPSSVKTYVSILFNINKKMNPENTDMSIFDNHDDILKLLADKPAQSRKTSLSALFVLTGNDAFNKQMIQDCETVNTYYKEQKKSQKEEDIR